MKVVRLSLLSATILASTFASAAQAQVTDPGVALQGLGASAVQIVLQQEINCLSGPAVTNANNVTSGNPNGVGNPTYKSTGAPIAVAPADYASSTKPLNCLTQSAQPNDSGKFVGSSSSAGRKAWENFTGFSLFQDGTPAWSHVHFAVAGDALLPADVTAFNAGAQTHAVGDPIQVPLYTVPVAIAYESEYGINGAGTALNFNVKSAYRKTQGGLRLSRANYCNIFNGVVTNWNDASLTAANGGQSLKDASDDQTRWNTDGVPIRLVGRADSSGTTDIFARHLAAVCGADVDAGGTNHYQQHAGGLPYDGSINLSNVDSNSVYTAFAAGKFANSTNDAAHMLLSGAYFNGTAIVTTDGTETAGKFLVADSSANVAAALKLAPDNASPSLTSTLLNGKIGYIGTDFIAPVNGSTLFAAALPQNNSSTTYLIPNAQEAALALTQLPPQSSSNGAFLQTDSRTVLNPTTGAQEAVDRANPLHWVAVLYTAQIGGVAQPTLADPTKGYPITGTAQFLPYQCFASANTRIAVNNLIAMITGKATKEAFSPYDAASFTNTSASTPGITSQAGIAPMPSAWNTAISQTFLLKSTQASNGFILGQLAQAYDSARAGYYTTAGTGGHGLWIQSAIPASAATLNAATANGNCTAGAGA